MAPVLLRVLGPVAAATALACAVGGCASLSRLGPLPPLSLAAPAFARTMEAYAGTTITSGNRLSILLNGEEIFPAVLADIRRAQRSITYAQYYWDEGAIGGALSEAIAERCRHGVPSMVLLDAFGALRMPAEHRVRLEDAGCRVALFHPLHDVGSINYRNHQRILVVDGRVGFTGGWGVGRLWSGNARRPDHWRETDVRVEGPVVHDLQSVFARAWMDTTGTVLGGDGYFPSAAHAGNVALQVVASDPQHGNTSVYTTLLLAIASAQHSVLLTSPYFVPDAGLRRALRTAVTRGVRVRLLLAGPIDWNIVRAAGRHAYGDLLAAGIEIYEYGPARLHAKTAVVDGIWASVGSANLDLRSLAINRELNLVAYDRDVAQRLAAVFEADLSTSHRLDVATWRARPFWRRLFEWLAVPVRDLL